MSNFANDGGVQHWVRVLRNDGVRGVCVDRRFGACVLAGGRDEGRVGPGGGVGDKCLCVASRQQRTHGECSCGKICGVGGKLTMKGVRIAFQVRCERFRVHCHGC